MGRFLLLLLVGRFLLVFVVIISTTAVLVVIFVTEFQKSLLIVLQILVKFWIILGQLHHLLLHSALGLLIVERRVVVGIITGIIIIIIIIIRGRIATLITTFDAAVFGITTVPLVIAPVNSPLGHALEEGVDVHIGQVGLAGHVLLVALPPARVLLLLGGLGLPPLLGSDGLRIGVSPATLAARPATDLALLGEGLILVEHRLDAALGDELARALGCFDHGVYGWYSPKRGVRTRTQWLLVAVQMN